MQRLTATVDPFLPAPRSIKITLKLLNKAMLPAALPKTVGKHLKHKPTIGICKKYNVTN